MAPVEAAIVETNVFISSINTASAPIRDEQIYYSSTSTWSPSNYSSNSTAPRSTSTGLTTIFISRTATITLTTIDLITSESIIATLAPTESSLSSPAPTSIYLSPGQITGIVLGAITFLLIIVLTFYLLTRAKWMDKFAKWPFKQQKKKHRRKTRRQSNETTNLDEKRVENPARIDRLNDRRQMGVKRTTETPIHELPATPLERRQEPNERPKGRKSRGTGVKRAGNGEYRVGSGKMFT